MVFDLDKELVTEDYPDDIDGWLSGTPFIWMHSVVKCWSKYRVPLVKFS